LALDFIVHELGNAASPILMIAEVIERDGTSATVTRSVGSLRETAANVRELAATVRYFRGDRGRDQLTPGAFADTRTWWRRLTPLFGSCVARSVRLTEEVTAVSVDDRTLATLTWCTIGVLRLVNCDVPFAENILVTCEPGVPSGVTMRISVDGLLPAELTPMAGRWHRFVAAEARTAGARFTVATLPTRTSFELSLRGLLAGSLRPGA
jgi:hypothetical protein